jgi:hypothetical protein
VNAAEITTPCLVCAVQAALKDSAFWAGRGLSWPVAEVAGHTAHKACASEVEHLIAVIGGLAVDAAGVPRWTASGNVPPDDTVALIIAFGLAGGIDAVAASAAYAEQTAEAIAAYRRERELQGYSDEELAQMAAAFGPGATVVDALTGQRIEL